MNKNIVKSKFESTFQVASYHRPFVSEGALGAQAPVSFEQLVQCTCPKNNSPVGCALVLHIFDESLTDMIGCTNPFIFVSLVMTHVQKLSKY